MMKVLVLTLAAVGTAMAGNMGGPMGGKGKKFMEMMGEKGGKMPDMMENMGKPSKPGMGKPSKGEMVQQMMAEKKGLCLSQDEVHMICGMGTNLQRKMDAALKQCMPMEMMAAANVDDMQDMSMSPDTKLLSSGRAFDFEEPSDRGMKKKVLKGKKGKKPSKKAPKKPSKSKKPTKTGKKPAKKPSKSKKPSKT